MNSAKQIYRIVRRSSRNNDQAITLKRAGLWLFLFLFTLTAILYTRVGVGTRVYAAASNNLNFQARLLTGSGAIVPDGNYSVQFNLYNVATAGTTQWTETQGSVPVRAGYLSVYLGSVTAFPSTIDWSQQQWLTMNVNGDGEMTPRLKLTAVPNALHSNETDAIRSGSNLLTAANLAQLAPTTPQVINSALAALRLNQTGAGLLAQLQKNGTDVFTIAGNGDLTSSGSATFSGGTLTLGSTAQLGGMVIHDGVGKTGTLQTTALTINRIYTLPDEAGTICLRNSTSCGFLLSGGPTGTYANGGNSFGVAGSLGTNDNFSLSFRTNNTNQLTLDTSGNLNFLTGGLQVAGTTVLTSGRVLQNVTADTGILTTGTLGVARGGTGVNGSTATNGQLLIGNGTGFSLGNLANNGGLTITNSAGGIGLAVNYGSTSTTAVRGDITLTCPSGTGNLNGTGNAITLGTGGTCNALDTKAAVSFGTSVTTPLVTNAGALIISTTGANDLTLTSGSGLVLLNASTIRRTAAGTTTFDFLDSANTTVAFTNSGAGNVNLSADGTITAGTGLTVSSGGAAINGNTSVASGTFTASGGLVSLNDTSNFGTKINTGTSTGTVTIGGGSSPLVIDSTNFDVSAAGVVSGITGMTFTSGSLNLASGGITNTGSLAGVSTLSLSGAISGATATNTINGLVINSGALSSITGITFTSGSLNLASGGITNAGAVSGVTTLNTSGLASIGGGATITGGNILIQRTGTGAALIIDRTDGVISSLKSGLTKSAFFFDNSGTFSISSDTRANIASGTGSGTDVLSIQSNGNVGIGTNVVGTAKLDVRGDALFRNTSDTTTAFQVQNSSSTSILRVDTAGGTANNLVANPSIESAIAGNWTAKGAATISQDATDYYYGSNSLKIITTAAANDGAKQNVALASNTTYNFSLFARSSAGNMAAFEIGYSNDGTTDVSCATAQSLVKSGWVKITCAFTTATVSGTPYIYAKQTDATARTAISIDAVMLQTEANNSVVYKEGQIALQGTITTPLIIQNTSDSTTALQVLSSKGANIFSIDSTDNNILAGNAGFEINATGWAYSGTGGSIVRSSAYAYSGSYSDKVTTSATANNGIKYTLASGSPVTPALLPSTQYTMSFYAQLDASSAALTDITMAYARDGATEVNCTPGDQVVLSAGWKRYSCSFTTDAVAPAAGAYLVIKQVGATAHTFYIDAVQLELGGAPTSYGAGGISLNASFTSPVSIKNANDSTSSFQVQDVAGTNFLSVDTVNDRVIVGTATPNTAVVFLQLDSGSSYAETTTCSNTVNQGSIYFNYATSTIRSCTDGSWEDIISTAGLGLLLYGVAPDTGTGNGDIGASSGATNGPCRVSWLSTTTVKIVQGCIAYSGGRKVTIPDNTTPTGSLTFAAGGFVHVCLNGANGQPAFSANGTETANMPTFNANNPVVCLADIKTSAAAITNIYDVRPFTTSTKTFVTAPANVGLGWIVVHHATNINAVTTSTTALNDTNTTNLTVRGVIAAYSGTVSTTTPNAILVTAGPQWVKATGASSINGYVGPSATAGYSGTYASNSPFSSSNFGSVLGISSRTIDTVCNATTNCQYSQFVNPIAVR